jgi:hypothetical protein
MKNEEIPPSLAPSFYSGVDWDSENDIIISSSGSLTMKGLLSFLCVSVGGAIGWWLGSFVGIMTAVFLSAIGSGVGLYFALRFHQEYFE